MGFVTEFKEFLNEYKILALAIAFVMGLAVTDLIQSLVKNIIMPLIAPMLSAAGKDWQTTTMDIGPFHIGLGAFLASVINFTIIALVIFWIAKKVMKQEKVSKI